MKELVAKAMKHRGDERLGTVKKYRFRPINFAEARSSHSKKDPPSTLCMPHAQLFFFAAPLLFLCRIFS